MSKRAKTSHFSGSLYHGYIETYQHERGLRQYRKENRTVRAVTTQLAMADAGGGAVSHRDKRSKTENEARLIPGVTGDGAQYGFPNEIITKLRYCDLLTLHSVNGAMSVNYFSANSIYDPDITNAGHQPMYRDNFASIYDLYVVLGCKITVHFTPFNIVQNWVCGITVDDNASISTVLPTKMEASNSKWGLLSMGGSGPMTVVETFAPQQFGIEVKDDGYSMTPVGSGPVTAMSFGVWAHAVDATITDQYVNFTVELEYTVKFAQLSTQAQN